MANPYDFSNPVSDEKLFIGREKEVGDVFYCLKQISDTGRPIHLAFIGDRAAGKTSFLNISLSDAKKLGFCTVRIDLDESDGASQLSFFRKFFSSLLDEVFEFGAFGGVGGKAYEAYIDLVSTYQTSVDPQHQPFRFANIIARALKSGNTELVIPDELLKRDLDLISSEVKVPIVFIIDECNVLKSNRITLEKIRNIFMNKKGYMLIMAGTGEFFPVIDDVFSPIARQFQKIDIGPFRDLRSAEECIKKPMSLIGISSKQITKLVPKSVIREIYILSGGRPYEIQLICHFLFKECQHARSRRFTLDFPTVEEIQRVIAGGKSVSERVILSKCKQFRRKTLQALSIFTQWSDRISLIDIIYFEDTFYGKSRFDESDLRKELNDLCSENVVRSSSTSVEFLGDAFDRLYLKYIARQKNLNVSFYSDTVEKVFLLNLEEITSDFECLKIFSSFKISDLEDSLENFLDIFEKSERVDELELLDRDAAHSPIVEEMLIQSLMSTIERVIYFGTIVFSSSIGRAQYFFMWTDIDLEVKFRRFCSKIEEMEIRARVHGWKIEIQHRKFTMPDVNRTLDIVDNLNDNLINSRLVSVLEHIVFTLYTDQHDRETAVRIADSIFRINGSRRCFRTNNIGYIYLASNKIGEAKLWLQSAMQSDDDKNLVRYNLGVAEFLSGNIQAALRNFQSVILDCKDENLKMEVLIRLTTGNDGTLSTSEDFDDPILLECAREAISLLEQQT